MGANNNTFLIFVKELRYFISGGIMERPVKVRSSRNARGLTELEPIHIKGLSINDVVRIDISFWTYRVRKGVIVPSHKLITESEFCLESQYLGFLNRLLASTEYDGSRHGGGEGGVIERTLLFHPTNIEPVMARGSGKIVTWGPAKPTKPLNMPLRDFRLCVGSHYGGRSYWLSPRNLVGATVNELGISHPEMDWVVGGEELTPIIFADRKNALTFRANGEKHVWYSERLRLLHQAENRNWTVLLSLGLTETSQQRFTRCRTCHKFTRGSGKRLRSHKNWQADFTDAICTCSEP